MQRHGNWVLLVMLRDATRPWRHLARVTSHVKSLTSSRSGSKGWACQISNFENRTIISQDTANFVKGCLLFSWVRQCYLWGGAMNMWSGLTKRCNMPKKCACIMAMNEWIQSWRIAYQQSYYNLSSVCAGERQGGSPMGKALVDSVWTISINY